MGPTEIWNHKDWISKLLLFPSLPFCLSLFLKNMSFRHAAFLIYKIICVFFLLSSFLFSSVVPFHLHPVSLVCLSLDVDNVVGCFSWNFLWAYIEWQSWGKDGQCKMSTELIVVALCIQKKLDSQSIFLQQQNFKNRRFCKKRQPLPGHFFSVLHQDPQERPQSTVKLLWCHCQLCWQISPYDAITAFEEDDPFTGPFDIPWGRGYS